MVRTAERVPRAKGLSLLQGLVVCVVFAAAG